MKIAIAGPGRSGTTLLVQIFKEVGFTTPPGEINEDACAGLESKIGENSPYEVDKDPWCYEYINSLTQDQLKQYSAFIIPIRNLNEAALSRSVQERFARAVLHENDHWKWNSSAQFAGGAIYDTSMLGISQVLSKGLWSLIEALARAGIQPRIILFPRFAEEFCYLWDQIGDIVSKHSTREKCQEVHRSLYNKMSIRAGGSNKKHIDIIDPQELMVLTEMLQNKVRQLQSELERTQAASHPSDLERTQAASHPSELERTQAASHPLTRKLRSLLRMLAKRK